MLHCKANLGETKVYFALDSLAVLYDLPSTMDVFWDCFGQIIPVMVYSDQLRDIEEE